MAMTEPTLRWRVGITTIVSTVMVAVALTLLLRPPPNACNMTYMYPTYVPVPAPPDSSPSKYGLFLYHEGWKQIDFHKHLRSLSGVPVLFIPGNGGSYKQVRSLAAESDRAWAGQSLEERLYQESSFTPEEAGRSGFFDKSQGSHADVRDILDDPDMQGEYVNHLDWFAVDLVGEHSALDGRILEEHTDYVVQAIHRILDQYREALRARTGKNSVNSEGLPMSVILVGHSMGGFVARAAVVHPKLRKGAVETILTLASPHLVAPVAFQPSLGRFFSRVNDLWKAGYEVPRSRSMRDVEPALSRVVVVSIHGGLHDYQVRSRMSSLDGIVPPTNALSVGAPGMLNTWLSTEHQTILWCNQLVVQLSHTLLKLLDRNTGQVFASPKIRLAVFIGKLRSALTQTFEWLPAADDGAQQPLRSDSDKLDSKGSRYSCPSTSYENYEKDFHAFGDSVTVLAMDGRRRWLDIKKQLSKGKDSFTLVTNIPSCTGIRIHLWPEKSDALRKTKPLSKRVVDVTRKMVQLPAGPAPRQIEPGGQTEQAPPSSVLRLTAKDLEGFSYITISVESRSIITGGPPPATSMAVGQFFDSREGQKLMSSWWLFSSIFKQQDIYLKENHPLIVNFTTSISLGVLPLNVDIETTSCGVSEATQHDAITDITVLCKLRCFPPSAVVWDPYSGLEVLPNLRSSTIIADSSPAFGGTRFSYHGTGVVLLLDPYCGYKISVRVAKSAALSRFLLTHALQIGGFTVAVVLFALMTQARAWEVQMPIPSIFACIERNLIFPLPFIPLCIGPLLLQYMFAALEDAVPRLCLLSAATATLCYVLANGIMALLATGTMMLFHATAAVEVHLRMRWHKWSNKRNSQPRRWLLLGFTSCFNLQITRKLVAKPHMTAGVVTSLLVFFVHPAVGLAVLLLWHTWCCHIDLRRYRHLAKQDEGFRRNGRTSTDSKLLPMSHLEAFKLSQGLLLLHLTATCMLLPSLVAWLQRPRVENMLWCLDSVLSFGVILHGFCADASLLMSSGPSLRWSFVYGVAGVYTYCSSLRLAPYRAFYVFATLGLLSAFIRFGPQRLRQGRSHLYKRRL